MKILNKRVHPVSLKFADNSFENDFHNYYISKYLWQLRLAHILAALLFFIAVYSERRFISEDGISAIIRLSVVIPSFLIGLVITFIATKFYKKYYSYFNVYYVLITGLSFILSGASFSSSPFSYMFYIGVLISLIFNYTFIKQDFLKSSFSGLILLTLFFIIAFSNDQTYTYLIQFSIYLVVCNFLGMFIAYSIEFDGRNTYTMMRKINKDANIISESNKLLEQKVRDRTSELETAMLKSIESEQYLNNIINNIGDPVFVKDSQSRLMLVNDAFCKLFEVPCQQIIGKTLAEEVTPEERESFLKIDKQVLDDGIENINEEQMTLKGGETRTISTRKTRYIDNFGNKFLIGIIRDITDRKKTELELINAKNKAVESERLKSAFLANMSHEIRTPMNGILGFSNLLLEPELNEESKAEYIRIINQSGERLLNTVTDIVEISKIEAGIIEVKASRLNIVEIVYSIVSFFQPQAQQKGLALNVVNESPETILYIETDKGKIDSILTNLIKNAIKYTDKGEITIYIKLKNGCFECCIKDTGIGVPKNRQSAIFNRFEQADIEDARVFQGSGLGLTIAKSYVEMLDGKIWVESAEGVGSEFCFTLPYKPESKQIHVSEKVDASNNKKFTLANNINILVVEDDDASAIFLETVLNEQVNKIFHVKTGEKAIEQCKINADFDVILMDIKMPGIDGYETTKKIREFNQDVIIIAQTAFAMQHDKEKAVSAGCNDFITKPINNIELIERITNQLNLKKNNT